MSTIKGLHQLCIESANKHERDEDIARFAFTMLESVARCTTQDHFRHHARPRAYQALETLNALEEIQRGQKSGNRSAFPLTKSLLWEALFVGAYIDHALGEMKFGEKLLSYPAHTSDSFLTSEMEMLPKVFRDSTLILLGWGITDSLLNLLRQAGRLNRANSVLLGPIAHAYMRDLLLKSPKDLLQLFPS